MKVGLKRQKSITSHAASISAWCAVFDWLSIVAALTVARHDRFERVSSANLLAADDERDLDPLALQLAQAPLELLSLRRSGAVVAHRLVLRLRQREDSGRAHRAIVETESRESAASRLPGRRLGLGGALAGRRAPSLARASTRRRGWRRRPSARGAALRL